MLNENYKGNIIHYSRHAIESKSDLGFCADEYSKFKYGAVNLAQKFGYDLAEKFINNCLKKTYAGKQIVILPSAYSHIPTASFYMMQYFAQIVNMYLYHNNYPVLQESKISRSVTYREDYGAMSAKERNLICKDKFHIDKAFLKDKVLLFLDDIKITGTHEQVIINMLNEHQVDNDSYMLYFANLVNKEISPQFENYLNNHYVSNLDDIDYIIKKECFCFNTRVIKYILNSQADDFDNFITKQSSTFCSELLFKAIGNEYYKFDSYARNLKKLESNNKYSSIIE